MIWTSEEMTTIPENYNCEMLSHNVNQEQLMNVNLPTDTYYIEYNTEEGVIIDLCRSAKMSNIFDMYYDKFGNNIRKIDFAYGRKNPKMWGYTPPVEKKRKAR